MSISQPTLMLIDGHSLAFRAFYALPVDSFQTQAGQHTNAIHGFIAMLISLLQNEKPDHLAVAFDISRRSFRTEEYPEYKGTRGETPEEFKGQVPLLQKALNAMGITTIEKENYEADDILATLATEGAKDGYRVLVVSGDRDTIQLVDDDVTLLYPSRQGVSELTRYDAEKVFEKYGVQPSQYPEIAALVGETSDNLPGVPRVGEKTAVKWINQFGSLDEILRRQDEIKGKVGESLRENAHLAVRNRRLNALVRDVELPVEPDDLKLAEFDMGKIEPIFKELEFRTLLQRVGKLAGTEGEGAATSKPIDVKAPTAQTLLDEELEKWLNKKDAKAVYIEEAGQTVTVGVATESESILLDWQPGKEDYAPLEKWLQSDAPKIVHEAKKAYKHLSGLDISLGGITGDPLLAAWIVRPQSPEKNLAEGVYRYLGEKLPEPDPNQLLPEEGDTVSAADIAWYALRMHDAVLERFDEGSVRVYSELEVPLLTVLSRLEIRGVEIDSKLLKAHLAELSENLKNIEAAAFEAIGREVNLSSPKQLQEVLFTDLDMPKTRKTRTGYSTDAAALAELQDKAPHPFLDSLLEHRDANKLRQIIEGLVKATAEDGRIHTTFQQSGTSTGRLASAEPNLQNIPVRSEEGRRIREAFTHSGDYDTLMTADYSQIEMRIMAHLSQDTGLIEAFNAGEDLHNFVGSRIFGVEPDEVSSDMRSKVKAMSYGLVYGLSAFGLAKQLKMTRPEAQKLMEDYFERFGGVRDYLRSVVEEARKNHFTETIFGRKRPFAELSSPNRMARQNAERAALNAPIQGSAADIIKIAMNGIERRITKEGLKSQMILQIHDELMFEVAAGEQKHLESLVREEMMGAATLSVPLEVQIGVGPNWNLAAH